MTTDAVVDLAISDLIIAAGPRLAVDVDGRQLEACLSERPGPIRYTVYEDGRVLGSIPVTYDTVMGRGRACFCVPAAVPGGTGDRTRDLGEAVRGLAALRPSPPASSCPPWCSSRGCRPFDDGTVIHITPVPWPGRPGEARIDLVRVDCHETPGVTKIMLGAGSVVDIAGDLDLSITGARTLADLLDAMNPSMDTRSMAAALRHAIVLASDEETPR